MSAPSIRYDLRDRPPAPLWLALSAQHLFAMFGATILVPYLAGLPPATGLVTSGLGTLVYLMITGWRIPAYLGSSFAFVAPIVAAAKIGGIEGAMVGCFAAGLVYVVVAALIRAAGVGWLLRLLPPVVVGPVIMVIGLGLAGIAVDMAMNDPATASYSGPHLAAAGVTLLVTLLAAVLLRGVLAMVPVLLGLVGGYLASLALGLVDFAPVAQAPLFAVPDMVIPFVTYTPQVSVQILVLIVPLALVTISEHIGDQMVLSKIAERDFLSDPGLHRSLLGDGVATLLASCLGGPPNTTYGENIGVIALTRVLSTYVLGGAAVLAVLFGFLGAVAAFISTVPQAVMGGLSVLLFGAITASGLRMLIDNRVDLGVTRNLIIVSVVLVVGIGGAYLRLAEGLEISGMALAALVGIFLNLVLPQGQEPAPHRGP